MPLLSALSDLPMAMRPIGTVTRGTTAPNRLRRVDRWTIASYGDLLRRHADPLVVDLGFGSTPVTTVEFRDRLRAVRPDVDVLGLEIDEERVAAAQAHAGPGLTFARGGFELPAPARRPMLVRAFNVLRQYDEREVAAAWARMLARLAPGGVLVEGTSDEVGRLACWVALTAAGPQTFTAAARLSTLERPSDLAERLPKVLIHRNVPGQPIHAFFRDLDRAWDANAGLAVFGARQRWLAAVVALRGSGWPVAGGPARWRLGEVTVRWDAVAPADPSGPGVRA
ncbi:MAG: SAM-dependent methyltransferase [Frankiales bacterium]|nr:SAM-dependent methyltransferase [Frankiales bacterium]